MPVKDLKLGEPAILGASEYVKEADGVYKYSVQLIKSKVDLDNLDAQRTQAKTVLADIETIEKLLKENSNG